MSNLLTSEKVRKSTRVSIPTIPDQGLWHIIHGILYKTITQLGRPD